jgi:3-isopropylmalate/(R)-2-methylmalate dehydratase large subunit
MTMTQKILGRAAGRQVNPGEFGVINVDLAYVQDGTGPLTVRQLEKMGIDTLADPARSIVFLDHASPSPRRELSNDHKFLREFSRKTGAVLSEIGNGISHNVTSEAFVRVGDVVIGADSHTCTGGAMSAFATGMGSTDVGVAMGLGYTWMRIPEVWAVFLEGAWPPGVFAKDFMLHFIGTVRADGATYKARPFSKKTAAARTSVNRPPTPEPPTRRDCASTWASSNPSSPSPTSWTTSSPSTRWNRLTWTRSSWERAPTAASRTSRSRRASSRGRRSPRAPACW